MKEITKKNSGFKRTISRALIIVMALVMFIPGISDTVADSDNVNTGAVNPRSDQVSNVTVFGNAPNDELKKNKGGEEESVKSVGIGAIETPGEKDNSVIINTKTEVEIVAESNGTGKTNGTEAANGTENSNGTEMSNAVEESKSAAQDGKLEGMEREGSGEAPKSASNANSGKNSIHTPDGEGAGSIKDEITGEEGENKKIIGAKETEAEAEADAEAWAEAEVEKTEKGYSGEEANSANPTNPANPAKPDKEIENDESEGLNESEELTSGDEGNVGDEGNEGYEGYEGSEGNVLDDESLLAPNVVGTGSISGILWVDSSGDLSTDWDGLYNGHEQPLAGYTVYLYASDNLTQALTEIKTGTDGTYIFEDLETGSYMVGLRSGFIGDMEYMLPFTMTRDNKIAIDWSSNPITAYSEVIKLSDGQAVQGQNAGMRLPMGIQPLAIRSIANLGEANKNDEVKIDNYTWVVVDKKTVGQGSKAVTALYLIMRGGVPSSAKFGDSTDYATSLLRKRFNNHYNTNRWPTINAMALVPDIGTNHSSTTAKTLPTTEMAGIGSIDVLFAPSLKDMVDWTGVDYGKPIPSSHPLSKSQPNPFPMRFWFRTSMSPGDVHGYIRANNSLEGGLSHNGYDNINDTPGVWVNAGAVKREVRVYYVDTDDKLIGDPTSKSYVLTIGDDFSLAPSEVPLIEGYKYINWKKGLLGSLQAISTNPGLSNVEMLTIKDIYLVYEQTGVDVTVSKDVSGGPADSSFTFTVYFADSSKKPLDAGVKFSYIGGTIIGSGADKPKDGNLTLEEGGKASFTLQHGQTISFKNVPVDRMIKVVEDKYYFYSMKYIDSKYIGIKETNMDYDVVGTDARLLAFFNTRLTIVPTGIDNGSMAGMAALPLAAISLILTGVSTVWLSNKRRKSDNTNL
ncbi:MAG: hypothetical protein FWH55_09375 [Oscillospiraceae bacterium]|nr:hypothetical protein [Oscillospiraceae bacterium]